MAKTLEEILLERRADPRAMRGAITLIGRVPYLTFGAVGRHKRISIKVSGDDFELAVDPRDGDEPEEDETEADRLAALKIRADELGVPYGANIGEDTLRDRVEEAERQKTAGTTTDTMTPASPPENE